MNLLNLTTRSQDYLNQFIMVASDFVDLNKRKLLNKERLERPLGNTIVEKPFTVCWQNC